MKMIKSVKCNCNKCAILRIKLPCYKHPANCSPLAPGSPQVRQHYKR